MRNGYTIKHSNTDTPPVYTKIKPARTALTAFAAQVVEKKLVEEAKKAVQP